MAFGPVASFLGLLKEIGEKGLVSTACAHAHVELLGISCTHEHG